MTTTWTLWRLKTNKQDTLGIMLDELGNLLCFTLEDTRQDAEKIPGETRIPSGTYKVELRTDPSPTNERYRKRFGPEHKGMLWVRDVPGFEYIYIHLGNTHKDTRGCVLVGQGYIGSLLNSELAYRQIYPKAVGLVGLGGLVLKVLDKPLV